LAANNWTSVQAAVVRCESSSESDGVEIVGVFPAASKMANTAVSSKSRTKTSQKSKAASVISTTGTVPNGINGTLGFNLNNMYINNNNNNKLGAGSVIRSSLSPTTGSSTALPYDLTRNPNILKKLSDLSALEKQMNWSPCSLLSTQGLKAANTAASNAGTGAGTGATGAGAGAGATSHQ